jgi:DNA-binding response OmpR family regulator
MTQRTILIAEDDFDLAQFLTLECRRLGFDVFRSPDAMHALLGAHRVKPALMVLDLNMPGGNGLSVCEMLAGSPELARIPVIIISGQRDAETIRRCRAAGARYVPKGPNLWKELATQMCQCLSNETAPVDTPQAAPAASAAMDSAEARTTSEAAAPAVEIAGPRPKIMSIDDDVDFSDILKRRLEPYGLEVFRAFSGMQGFWSSLDIQPDVIISDLQMADGDGTYMLHRLRTHSLTERTPVIILTGETNPALKRQLLAQGAEAYLIKPLNLDELLERLRPLVPLACPARLPKLA